MEAGNKVDAKKAKSFYDKCNKAVTDVIGNDSSESGDLESSASTVQGFQVTNKKEDPWDESYEASQELEHLGHVKEEQRRNDIQAKKRKKNR